VENENDVGFFDAVGAGARCGRRGVERNCRRRGGGGGGVGRRRRRGRKEMCGGGGEGGRGGRFTSDRKK
jgi:hypothetical protein